MTRLPPLSPRAAVVSLCLLLPVAAQAGPTKSGVVAGSGTTAGGVFSAGVNGADYVLPSQAKLRLAPGAQVRLFPVPQSLQLAPGAKTTTWSFALIQGRVDVTVPRKPRSAVLASIGKLSAIVTSGQASVIASPDSSTVANGDGEVRTLLNEHWQTLAAGTLARFGAHNTGEPQPAIAAPTFAPGQRLWFSPGGAVTVNGFSFAAVQGATSYAIRLRRHGDDAEQLRTITGGTALREGFSLADPGEYRIAVRSFDAEGLAGRWSQEQSVRVVGVILPAGGYIEGADLFVGPGQEVRFSHTDGLEMTYEGAGRYVPASEAVSLYRGETTMVSFRVPGSLDATSTRLRPRNIFAHVAIGPRRAVWPKDAVEIVVELRATAGRSVPTWLELKPEVRLGIEPLDVVFSRDGNRLVGSVPVPDKPGPWVLRVEVKDQFGASLGRDFLEIAQQAPSKPVKLASK